MYKRLARGIARYNTSTSNINISWPDIMRDRTLSNCHACEYSRDVRNTRFGLPYRQYILLGGSYPVGDVNAGQELCFAYGEREWVNGKVFDEIKQNADDVDIAGKPQTPIGRVNCLTGVDI